MTTGRVTTTTQRSGRRLVTHRASVSPFVDRNSSRRDGSVGRGLEMQHAQIHEISGTNIGNLRACCSVTRPGSAGGALQKIKSAFWVRALAINSEERTKTHRSQCRRSEYGCMSETVRYTSRNHTSELDGSVTVSNKCLYKSAGFS